jgi:radical SAM superfamily enzyme YgiQ (UPF0313 family)
MNVRHQFQLSELGSRFNHRRALLINPPVYDTQYWAEWAQPYGLLRIAALLRNANYGKVWLYDFMETGADRKVEHHRINFQESYGELDRPNGVTRPVRIEKGVESLDLQWRHFGKSWEDFEAWVKVRALHRSRQPHEIWITSVMTYWWESTRDLIERCRRLFPNARIVLGGIYPTLAPQHAAEHCKPDVVVAGEVKEANDLWTDLSLYSDKPTYAIITPSRGCPFDCSYCAQKTINDGLRRVRFRTPSDIVTEMKHKADTYGIKDFAFYADFLLWNWEDNLLRVLDELAACRKRYAWRLYAPEGLDTRFLSQDQRLLDRMKEAGFQKIYLPVENIDDSYLAMLNRRHVKLEHFVKAAEMCAKAGFRLRNLDVNAFVLYGLPSEKVHDVVKTILFVSEVCGSVIPMLFAPVPTTGIFARWLPWFRERGWDTRLERLNGKLYPFLETTDGTISDYIDLQRLMFTLNQHFRSSSFQIFGNSLVSRAFLDNLRNGFEGFVRQYVSAQPLALPHPSCAQSAPHDPDPLVLVPHRAPSASRED